MLEKNVFTTILAGGSGTRFWPKSRLKNPKQLCVIGTSKTSMLEQTLGRIESLTPLENTIIVTHHEQMFATQMLAAKKCQHFLAEPEAKNTACALAMAALEIQNMASHDDAIMVSMHADAVIKNEKEFALKITEAVQIAKSGKLTLMGIKPEYPETGYGYIQKGLPLSVSSNSFTVASFKEKPDLDGAKKYCESSDFLWNSGLFIFPVKLFLAELRRFHPDIVIPLEQLLKGKKSFREVSWDDMCETYSSLPKIAVDNAVLEKSAHVAVLECSFGWKDVGSWDALGDVFGVDKNGNFIVEENSGRVLLVDTENSVVESDGPLIATLGIRDFIIVHHKGALLVCPKSKAQDVKLIVEKLKQLNHLDLV